MSEPREQPIELWNQTRETATGCHPGKDPNFTDSELATIRADLAECEREAAINAAAKKVADAAVAVDMVGKIISRTIRRNEFLGITASVLVAAEVATLHAFGGTVREYRKLTEGETDDLNMPA